ncbi:MAG: RluA family pseudouridine synthase [Lachnospiraceae bacterium]|nr:RluA family pseudouridine synthase [Lachnospiraceae bacterium]
MKEFNIPSEESGQKLLRFLNRILPEAGNGLLHKMLRKKNITINGKKCTGNEELSEGDSVKIFFSDETFLKFTGKSTNFDSDYIDSLLKLNTNDIEILYESEDIVCINKKPGMLSQKSSEDDVSANELLIAYLFKNDKINSETLKTFKPSVINRLDRNTSGILIFGKTMKGIKYGTEALKNNDIRKTYKCIVKGIYSGPEIMEGYLSKDEDNNYISYSSSQVPDSKYMKQEVMVDSESNGYSCLTVTLHTGRSHQIRSSLSYYGNPIIGDVKYGDKNLNNKLHVKRPLLHSYSCIIEGNLIIAPEQEDFIKFKEKYL